MSEINIYALLIILVVHYVADFICQSHRMSINKSKDNKVLTDHVFMYAMCWLGIGLLTCPLFSYTSPGPLFLFCIITFCCHWVQDYWTSRWTSRLYKEVEFWNSRFRSEGQYALQQKGKYSHKFFLVIGLDQLLHYVQLVLIYQLLK